MTNRSFNNDPILRILEVAGGAITDLGLIGHGPRWSPDGSWIAYLRGGDGGELIIVRPDGTGLRELATGPKKVYFDWSPDSQWILGRLDVFFPPMGQQKPHALSLEAGYRFSP